MIPGEIIAKEGQIELNAGRNSLTLTVANRGDRPIQVGSHFHFFEANRWLDFPRERAFGRRLDIPSGTAVRFEPGEAQSVTLVALGGQGVVQGLNGKTAGCVRAKEIEINSLKQIEEWVKI